MINGLIRERDGNLVLTGLYVVVITQKLLNGQLISIMYLLMIMEPILEMFQIVQQPMIVTLLFQKVDIKRKVTSFWVGSTDENATSPQYTAGQSFTYQTDGDTVFYAVWAKSDFEVKFHGNGSSAADYTANLTYNKSVSLPKNIFDVQGIRSLDGLKKKMVIKKYRKK